MNVVKKKTQNKHKLYRMLHNDKIYQVVNRYIDKDKHLVEERRIVLFLNQYGFHRKTGSRNYYVDYFDLENTRMYKVDSLKVRNYFKENQLIINYIVRK